MPRTIMYAETDTFGYATDNGVYKTTTPSYSPIIYQNNSAFYRFAHQIPMGATIHRAYVKFFLATDTLTANISANVLGYLEYKRNAKPPVNNEPWNTRQEHYAGSATHAYTSATNTWTSPEMNMTIGINEIVARPNNLNGGYFNLRLKMNSNVYTTYFHGPSAQTANKPYMVVEYSPSPMVKPPIDYNIIHNNSFSQDMLGWYSTTFGDNTGTINGTITRDNTFQRRTGFATLKFETPAPDGTKTSGPTTTVNLQANTPYIFCGWIYVPAAVTGTVKATFGSSGGDSTITARDTWVPFCTTPTTFATQAERFASIRISDFSQGQNIWISDVAVFESKIKQLPFSSTTPNQRGVTHTSHLTTGFGQVERVVIPNIQHPHDGVSLLEPFNVTTVPAEWTTPGGFVFTVVNNDSIKASLTNQTLNTTYYASYTKNIPMTKRYLAIDFIPDSIDDYTPYLDQIVTDAGTINDAFQVVREGNWYFYEVPAGTTMLQSFRFRMKSRGSTASSITINELGESDYPSVSASTQSAKNRFVLRSDGIWSMAQSIRQNVDWTKAKTLGQTYDQVEAAGKTWDDMENSSTLV